MYVKRLFYDDHSDPFDLEKCIEFPAWEDAERVINKLDGKNTTQICMDNGDEDNYFCIGGGNDGLCNVFVSESDNEIIHTLVNPDFQSSVMHKLVTGGQQGDFEDKICVSVQLAKTAAKGILSRSNCMMNSCGNKYRGDERVEKYKRYDKRGVKLSE